MYTSKRGRKQTMTINEMKNNVIRTFGFEHPATIYFFGECERTDDIDIIEVAYWFAMGWKDEDEDEE